MRNADDLLIFLSVARGGSITAASRAMQVDPATIGRKIQRLEDQLGAALFAKSPKGYALTDDGQRLLVYAQSIETALRDAEGDFLGRQDKLTGKLRIGAPDGCATFLLPHACARITKAHPDLAIDILTASERFDIHKRDVDVMITVTPLSSKALHCQELSCYELHFGVSHDLAARMAGGLPLTDIPLISFVTEHQLDPALDIPPAFRHREPSLCSNSAVVQWEWVKTGAGIGLLHDFSLRHDYGLTRLHPDFAIARQYYVSIRRDEMQFRRMKRFLPLLQQAVKEVQTTLSA
ncbi:LysR family transcriptional regulator [Yoonia sediminilitoris]|uniref:LysR family transcriptional regulator n=1 Tax=Yoonia sediminilitoris TaxID=1286148 RepID=A0A2T6KMR0_9RHOB|nr:LysR family transcriptional regulator [Yoonia sediminilitoris]PUB17498.1 LysR family transcriptional regulator [Yoonia sediminilitoris]RCW97793.1 LysR family transcriptional regulator [Yoonia sediminilitoris]